jgi:hypothetical protein
LILFLNDESSRNVKEISICNSKQSTGIGSELALQQLNCVTQQNAAASEDWQQCRRTIKSG